MNITRSGDIPSAVGPADYFSGQVRIDAPFKGSGALGCATVTFEPGARTAWHTHPLGQTILITFGLGLVQREGGPIEQVRLATSSSSNPPSGTGMGHPHPVP